MGWFTPNPPLISIEKAWVERRMCWLADHFGIERLLNTEVILPTEEYFPAAYQGSPDCAHQIMLQLCEHLGISADPIELVVLPDEQMPEAAGLYEKQDHTVIRVAQSQLRDPERLVATLAHELSHELLYGRGLISDESPDHEWVTDLLPVFLGLGIFGANSVLREGTERMGAYEQWAMSSQGYLPARMFGYSLAVFAFLRGELDPSWAQYLRLDAASVLKSGIRYLKKTDDTLLHPDSVYRRSSPVPESDLLIQLRSGSASARIAAVWDVRERELASTEIVEAVCGCLDHRDPYLPGEAADCLGSMGEAAQGAIPHLFRLLQHHEAGARAKAGAALLRLNAPPDDLIPDLTLLLQEQNKRIALVVAEGLIVYGKKAEQLAPKVLDQVRIALIDCDDHTSFPLLAVLPFIVEDAEQTTRDFFAYDNELCEMALSILRPPDEEQP